MERCSCPQGTSCHHVSGECGCPPGFMGNGCEQSEQYLLLLPNLTGLVIFGGTACVIDLSLKCTCDHPPSNPTPTPPSACLPGTFGQNCNQVCQCSETNQLCHPVSGSCYCAPGFHGLRCDQSTPNTISTSYNTEADKRLLQHLASAFSLWRGTLWPQLRATLPV